MSTVYYCDLWPPRRVLRGKEKMVRAVGFRNLVVHEYGELDLEVVFRVCYEYVGDLEEFARVLIDRFG